MCRSEDVNAQKVTKDFLVKKNLKNPKTVI